MAGFPRKSTANCFSPIPVRSPSMASTPPLSITSRILKIALGCIGSINFGAIAGLILSSALRNLMDTAKCATICTSMPILSLASSLLASKLPRCEPSKIKPLPLSSSVCRYSRPCDLTSNLSASPSTMETRSASEQEKHSSWR